METGRPDLGLEPRLRRLLGTEYRRESREESSFDLLNHAIMFQNHEQVRKSLLMDVLGREQQPLLLLLLLLHRFH